MRRQTFPPAPSYDADAIRAIRQTYRWSQTEFADALNVSAGTLRNWEQGIRAPDSGIMRLLEIAERAPDALRAILRTLDC
jgi:putative transcriptional regulator